MVNVVDYFKEASIIDFIRELLKKSQPQQDIVILVDEILNQDTDLLAYNELLKTFRNLTMVVVDHTYQVKDSININNLIIS